MRGQAAQTDERIANLVEDAAGQLADQLDLFRMSQRLQHLFALTQVREDRHEVLRGPIRRLHRTHALPHQMLRPVFPPIDESFDKGMTRANRRPQTLIKLGRMFSGLENGGTPA